MGMPLPESLVDLSTALSRTNDEVNMMGRVGDFMPPTQTRRTDWMCTFSITDRTLDNDYDEALKIRFFRPTQDELPKIQSSGDVVLLRNVKIKEYQGMTMGLSSHGTTWIVFQADSIPQRAPANALSIKCAKSRQAAQPKHAELLYAIELCNLRDRNSDKKYALPAPSPKPSLSSFQSSSAFSSAPKVPSSLSSTRTSFCGRDKFALVKDLQIDTFYDLVGQVVKTFPNTGRLEMYFTDYSSNNLLYRYEWDKPDKENTPYGDEYGYLPKTSKSHKWPGPYGQMTIMVTLWPPHSHFAQSNVKEDDYVLLQNVRAKVDKDGKMEASLNGDRLNPSKVNVRVLTDHDDDRVKGVLRRKREYAEKFKLQSAQLIAQVRKQNGEEKPLSKGQKRKKQRLEREKAKLRKFEDSGKKRKLDDHEYHYHAEPEPLDLSKTINSGLNKSIHCSHLSIPPRPLSSILSLDSHQNTTPAGTTYILPFQNIRSRATVRVVGFFPTDLAQFSVLLPKPSEFDALSDHEPSDSDTGTSGQLFPQNRNAMTGEDSEDERRWEWRFGLVLEDASEEKVSKGGERVKMDVYVAEQDAEFLLKLDAEDLRANDQALATLREKLFLLWGDLEERRSTGKDIQDLNTPRFECCLQEYGIRSQQRRKGPAEQSEGDADSEDSDIERELGWERRWRMFGTTIV